jgi:hypothetical protein
MHVAYKHCRGVRYRPVAILQVPVVILQVPGKILQLPGEILPLPGEILQLPGEILQLPGEIPQCMSVRIVRQILIRPDVLIRIEPGLKQCNNIKL